MTKDGKRASLRERFWWAVESMPIITQRRTRARERNAFELGMDYAAGQTRINAERKDGTE